MSEEKKRDLPGDPGNWRRGRRPAIVPGEEKNLPQMPIPDSNSADEKKPQPPSPRTR